MKKNIHIIQCLLLISFLPQVYSQNAIFLHHSIGEGMYNVADVAGNISSYNSNHGTSYSITEREYPNTPYDNSNMPYDYWNLWLNGACNNAYETMTCFDNLCSEYNLIILKHCYPGSEIVEDDSNPSVGSAVKTIANYKLQYRALRDLFDSYPNNRFIVWTLAPSHRLGTTVAQAARAREFATWVKNDWLTEDGNPHPNIYIYDFFGYVAESDPTPSEGQYNCIKYRYEVTHTENNGHPNNWAYAEAGPYFIELILDVFGDMDAVHVTDITVSGEAGATTISTQGGSLQLLASISPANATNKNVIWSVQNGSGQANISSGGLLTAISNGTITAVATAADGSGITGELNIEITNQSAIVTVAGITVSGEGGATTISTQGGSLQLLASITPANATNKNVIWSVQNGIGQANIGSSGLLTAVSNGTITAVATAADGSGVTGELDIEITNQVLTNVNESEETPFVVHIGQSEIYLQCEPNALYDNIQVYGIWGNLVYTADLQSNITKLNISSLPSGPYIVYLSGVTGKAHAIKVVKPW